MLSKLAIPLLELVASSALTVMVEFSEPPPDTSIPSPAVRSATKFPVVSVPRATELACIVVEMVMSPKLVMVALPTTSPLKATVGSATSKSIVPSVSWYVAVMPLSVLLENIAPTKSWTCSVFRPTVIPAVSEPLLATSIPVLLAVTVAT